MKRALKYGAILIGTYLIVAHADGSVDIVKGLGQAGSHETSTLQGKTT